MRSTITNLIDRFSRSNRGTDSASSSENTEQYRRLIEASPAPTNLFDASGDIVWGNDAAVDLLGLETRADLVGRSIFEFLDRDDRYTAEQELLAVVEEKTATGPTSMELHRDDGGSRRIRVSTTPGNYEGQDVGQAVIIDVTPLEDVRENLERERQFVEDTLDALHDVFYVINTDGTLVRWNDALLERSGYTETDVRRMAVEDFFVEEDVERISESIEAAFREGEDIVEATVVTNGGNRIPYEFRKRRLVVDGEVVGLVGIGRDVSERHARDQHLRVVDRLLQHNLRNQLTIVQGSAQILGEELEGETLKSVDRIELAVERLLSIFDNHRYIVELFSDYEERTARDVVPIVERAIETSRDTHPSASIELHAPENPTVLAVPVLERALLELLDNAVRHNDRADISVDVGVEVVDSNVRIRIADNGPPIPAMERNVVTEKVSTRPTYHSEGLGLWFVYWVAKQSGGTLSFEDNDPRGNVVTMLLPTPPDI